MADGSPADRGAVSAEEFQRKYGLLTDSEREVARAVCATEGHTPELALRSTGSKLVDSLVWRCARCRDFVENRDA